MASPLIDFRPPVDVSEFVQRNQLSPAPAAKNFQRIDWVQVKNMESGIIAIGVNVERERYYQISKETIRAFLDASRATISDAAKKEEATKKLLTEILNQPPQAQLYYAYSGITREKAISTVTNLLTKSGMTLDKLLEWDLPLPGLHACVGVSFAGQYR